VLDVIRTQYEPIRMTLQLANDLSVVLLRRS
jgi:hypothetical protein